MADSTKLFSDRVDDYVKYRPNYPKEVIDLLRENCGLTPEWQVADLGSGPGNLSRLFLDNGNTVFGVEPNTEMREAAEHLLGGDPRFRSVHGRAEETTLPPATMQLVTAGQAFHWFDPLLARAECQRILVAGGCVALIWNSRLHDATPFLSGYEAILGSVLPAYSEGKARSHGEEHIFEFFGREPVVGTFNQSISHTWRSLSGLLLSTSYVPKSGQDGHEAIMEAMHSLFDREQVDGRVQMIYETIVFYGRLG